MAIIMILIFFKFSFKTPARVLLQVLIRVQVVKLSSGDIIQI